MQSKRAVRREYVSGSSKGKKPHAQSYSALLAQRCGEMIAIMLYRARTLGKQAAGLTNDQRTVYLISAEQCKLRFYRAVFEIEYLDYLLQAEGEYYLCLFKNLYKHKVRLG